MQFLSIVHHDLCHIGQSCFSKISIWLTYLSHSMETQTTSETSQYNFM